MKSLRPTLPSGRLIFNGLQSGYAGYDFNSNGTNLVTILPTGNVGIGTTSPAATAVLDVTSTTKGFLPPRMTTAQRDAIASPATGLMVFNTTTAAHEYYTGTAWMPVGSPVPNGTIAAFAATTCPTGWSEYTAARGRFLRGIDNGAGNDPSGTRAAGNVQTDDYQSHSHTATDNGVAITIKDTSGGSGGAYGTVARPDAGGAGAADRSLTIGSSGGSETRPKNVAVTFCQYNGTAGGGGGATSLVALSDVSVSSPANGQVLGYNSTSGKWENTTAAGSSQWVDGTSGAIYYNGGNVGIGTTSPDAKITAVGNYNALLNVYRNADVTAVGPAGADIQLGALSGTTKIAAASIVAQLNNPATTGELFFHTRTAGALTEKLRITSTGNVGIGTTSPGTALSVSVPSDGTAALQVGSAAAADRLKITPDAGANVGVKLLFSTGNGATLDSSGPGYGTPLRLNPNGGNVGIGTASPPNKLTIEGGVTEIRTGGYLMLRPVANDWDFRLQSFPGNKLGIFSGGDLGNPVATFVHGGNVGIGTTSPTAPLHLVGAGMVLRLLTGTNSSGYSVDFGLNDDGVNFANNSASRGYNFKNATGTLVSIAANGNVGIGTTSPGSALEVSGLITGGFGAATSLGTLDWNHGTNARSGSGYTALLGSAANGPGGAYYFHPFAFEYLSKNGTGNMTQFAISYGNSAEALNNGPMFVRGRYSGSWTGWYKFTTAAVSDYRAKEDIFSLSGALAKVSAMRPVSFRYKTGKGPEGLQDGFIAHELQAIAPYSVTGQKDAVDSAGHATFQSVDLARLTPLLAAAIQELKAANDNLAAQNAILVDRLDALEDEIKALQAR